MNHNQIEPKDHHVVLMITPFFSPNIGGVETRLDNILSYLNRHHIRTWVETYQPITSTGLSAPTFEKRGHYIRIHRTRWLGGDLFHKLLHYPFLEALYLCPGLLIQCGKFLRKHHHEVVVIHALGFNAAFIARLFHFLFKIPYIVTIHTLYRFPRRSVSRIAARWVLNGARKVLALSEISRADMISTGLPPERVGIHVNWIDVDHFRPRNKEACKKKLGLENKFVVIMVARLKKIKGVEIALELCRRFQQKDLALLIIGDGEMKDQVREAASQEKALHFLDRIPNRDLPEIYSAGDVSLVPSLYPEGFARVVLESLGCGLPVIASRRGCIPEEVNEQCAILVEPAVHHFEAALMVLYHDRNRLMRMSRYARTYCLEHYSDRNMSTILAAYHMTDRRARRSLSGGERAVS